MTVRKAAPNDWRELRRLANALLGPGEEIDWWNEQVFVCDAGEGRLCGFISVSRRPRVEGIASGPVANIEAWFVERKKRRQGFGKKLMNAAEHWARLNGFSEISSDSQLERAASLAAHASLGFERTLALQFFRKPLAQAARRVAGQG